MAIELPLPAATVTKREERTDEAVLSAFLGQAKGLSLLRVTRDTYSDGEVKEVSRRHVQIPMSMVQADPEALAILIALPGVFDRLIQTNDDAIAAAAAAAAAAEAARVAARGAAQEQ